MARTTTAAAALLPRSVARSDGAEPNGRGKRSPPVDLKGFTDSGVLGPAARLGCALLILVGFALIALAPGLHRPKGKGLCPGSATGYALAVDLLANGPFSEEHWDYFVEADPTGGPTAYLNRSTAVEDGLILQGNGWTTLRTGKVQKGMRQSVRLQSRLAWKEFLLEFSYSQVPHGCGVWPALWLQCANESVCKPWPVNGEIDLLECARLFVAMPMILVHVSMEWPRSYANEFYSKSSLHLGRDAKCILNHTMLSECGPFMDKNSMHYNCATDYFTFPPKYGCAPNRDDTWPAPKQLNARPSTLVAEWTQDAVKLWNFPYDDLPADLLAQSPEPRGWGPKYLWSYYPLAWSHCPSQSDLRPLNVILNIAFCGDWAGGDWTRVHDDGSAQSPWWWAKTHLLGQGVTCASLHGMAGRTNNREACNAFVLSDKADAMLSHDSRFNISSFRGYEKQRVHNTMDS
eukprot:6178575-Pleurochrysis_carterae.AAC.5